MKLSWRLTWMALLFVAMFALLFTRLWFVQIAAGETYDRQAVDQIVRLDPTLAPRGNIIDRHGTPMATSRLEPWIVVDRKQILLEDEDRVIQQLSGLLELAAHAARWPPAEWPVTTMRSGSMPSSLAFARI